ncbi:MAG: efflux RND transporter periplasmic adaptor subunit [Gammaproteobacteria bacterium]
MKISKLFPPLPLVAVASFAMATFLVWSSQPVSLKAEPLARPPSTGFANTVAGVGLVEASGENVALSTPVPGLITSVYVKAGGHVHVGQPLYSLDDRDLKAALAVREAELQSARAALDRLQQMPRAEDLPPLQARVAEADAALGDARLQLKLLESVDDPRAIRREDLLRQQIAVRSAEAKLANARAELQRTRAGAWNADIEVARSQLSLAEQRVTQVRTDIARLTVTAPCDGAVLQLNARAGEYAQSGPLAKPIIMFGDTSHLNIRTDIDEHEAQALRPDAQAYAYSRGDAEKRIPLKFVRVEPMVVPKRQLTGDVSERVDTRVLQVIYQVATENSDLYVGQQMDVYVQRTGMAATGDASAPAKVASTETPR